MNKKWLILILLVPVVVIGFGFIQKKSSGVRPNFDFSNKTTKDPEDLCLTNEIYEEVGDNAPVLSLPFDPDDYSTKHWGMVPFCANLRSGSVHGGMDFELKANSKIYAATDGEVEKAYVGKEEGSGEILGVRGDGFTLGYSGLKNLQVKVGDSIKKGDYIANAVRIPHGEHHLHLDISINKVSQCLLKYMDDEFLAAFKEMFAEANYGSQTDAKCACDCESFTPNY